MNVGNTNISRLGLTKTIGLGVCLIAIGFGLASVPYQSRAAATQSALDRAVAENEIRQKIAEFSLLADGDGETPPDYRAMADNIYTPEAVIGGVRITRDQLVAQSKAQKIDPTLNTRHLMISTVFDEITPKSAKTRTVALYLQTTKNMIGPDCKKAALHEPTACGSRVVRAAPYLYQETWAKTSEGWRKTESVEIIR